MSSPLSVWMQAARPRTLSAGVAPVLMGTAMAYDAGAFHALSALAALTGALLIQIGTNFANDYFDFVKGADAPDRVGPTRATAAGLIKPETMRLAMIVVFALVFIPGAYILYRGGLPFLIIGLVSIACGILYTGGPYPLAYIGLGDLFVLIFFGPVAFGGTYYLQAGEITPIVLLAGFIPGLFSTAILTINNLRDIETDARAGKTTLAVRFGKRFARIEYFVCVVVAGVILPILLIVLTPEHGVIIAASALVVQLFRKFKVIWSTEPGPHLNEILALTGQVLLSFSIVFAVGWVL